MICLVADLGILRVYETSREVNGVKITEKRCEVRSDFGILKLKIKSSVTITEGFNGRAYISVRPYDANIKYGDNFYTKKLADFSEVIHWEQGSKISDDEFSSLWKK